MDSSTQTPLSEGSLKEILENTQVISLVNADQTIICLDKFATVRDALLVLADNHLLSVPVKDDDHPTGFQGFLDVVDIVSFLVSVCKDLNSLQPELFLNYPVVNLIDASHKVEYVIMQETDTALNLLTSLASGVHRVAVVSPQGKLKHVISQSDMLRYLVQYEQTLEPLCSQSIKKLRLVKEWVLFVSKQDRALTSYKKMKEHKISAIAITDPSTDALLGTLTASDLTGMSTQKEFKNLMLPNLEFMAKQRNGSVEVTATCQQKDTLSHVWRKVIEEHEHRLFVVGEHMKPVGIVTLTDICQAILIHLG